VSVDRILLTTDTVGGVWTYALDLAGSLGEIGVETVLVTMGPPPCDAQRAAVASLAGVTLVETDAALDWLARDPDTIASAAHRIGAVAHAHGVDVVQLNAPALAAGIDFGMPVVVVAHSCLASWWDAVETGPLPEDFAWRDALTRAGLLAADVVVAPSHGFAAAVRRVHQLPATPRVVHNGRAPLLASQRPQASHAFTAGRLWDRGKDLDTLDRAAALGPPILAAGPLVGPGGDTGRFDHLTCLGTLDAATLGERLAMRPVFVSAALYEPFGLAVLEAAQAGCALVLSDIATFRELWSDAAIFVAPRDAEGFAAAIEDLLAHPAERARRGAQAAKAAQRYTVAAMRDAMAAVYVSVTGADDRAGDRAAA
jgi:glycosyltransferase involved in cell wall biosynthesis